LAEYIDWTLPSDLGIDRALPPFSTIVRSAKSRSLYDDMSKMLDLMSEKWFGPRHHRLLAATRRGDDIAARADDTRAEDCDLPYAAPATGKARRPLQRRAV
jgi:hypothetical protein